MSEEQMNDSTFARLFIIMVVVMSVLTAIIMVLASLAASDVNAKLDERAAIENSGAIETRIAPVGSFSAETSAPVAAAPVTLSGEEAYSSCAACHAAGIAGAPAFADVAAWTDRIAKGLDALYTNAINGYQGVAGYMPPKGGNAALSDESVKAAVDYMADAVK